MSHMPSVDATTLLGGAGMRPIKIISGGQTGVDQAALRAAREVGIATGGTAPQGYLTEDGPCLELVSFGLVEGSSPSLSSRTLRNVFDSDATVLFGDITSPGSRYTLRCCRVYHTRPVITNPDHWKLRRFVKKHDVKVLNVGGNRLSVCGTDFANHVHDILVSAFRSDTPDVFE